MRRTNALYDAGSMSAEGVGLVAYMNIFHTFGHAKYIKAAQNCGGSTGNDVYFKAVTDAMHYNFEWYFETLLARTISADAKALYADKNYPVFFCAMEVMRSCQKKSCGFQMTESLSQPAMVFLGFMI